MTDSARIMSLALCVSLSLPAACARPPQVAPPIATCEPAREPEPSGPVRHVVLVTIDGLVPEAYLQPDAHGLRVPTLRRLAAEGAFSPGALSVFPSVTYPAHSSIVTGVRPRRHGIVSNRIFDPLEKSQEAWYWFTEDFKVEPLWEIARRAGYRTAVINWPVTVGARATWLVSEYWRVNVPEDVKLLRALATPGLLDGVRRSVPDFDAHFAPPDIHDAGVFDIVTYLIQTHRPHLVLLHVFELDGAQHEHGLWSKAANAAIENADRQLQRLLDAIAQAGIAQETVLVVASDHGFTAVRRQVHPGALLREAGLLELDDKGHVRDWKVSVAVTGGAAYLYERDPNDAASRARAHKLFAERAGRPGSGIGALFEREQIEAEGGDANAIFALEAEPGAFFGPEYAKYESATHTLGMHGYDPERPEMKASLILFGPPIKPGPLANARLIDIAPTIASWLGLELAEIEGKPLQ